MLEVEKGVSGMQVLVTTGLVYKNEKVDCSSASSQKMTEKKPQNFKICDLRVI